MKRTIFGIMGVLIFFAIPTTIRAEEVAVTAGKAVTFDYTLTVDGQVFDSSEVHGPLRYTHGRSEIISGLEKQLEGLHVGDEKSITVEAKDAYGEKDPQSFREIAKSSLPTNIVPQVGMVLQATSPEGKSFPAVISEVKKDTLVLDLNRPLAGKTLNFQVKIKSIQ